MKTMSVALAGNPNSGKSSIFNKLTGSKQHIANYPGVTVEIHDGSFVANGMKVMVRDLPGTYSLSARSVEERTARYFLVEEQPDVVVNIVDAANLERNLYFTTQLMDLGVNLVLGLNMTDEAKKQGLDVDAVLLSERLNCPVVETVGNRGDGINDLKEAVVEAAKHPCRTKPIDMGPALEGIVREVEKELKVLCPGKLSPRFSAMKLIEGDNDEYDIIRKHSRKDPAELESRLSKITKRIQSVVGESAAIMVGDQRYGFAMGLARESTEIDYSKIRVALTDKIDNVLLNRFLGLPFFLFFMYLLFWMTFTLGEGPMGWIESGFGLLAGFTGGLWGPAEETVLKSLLIDGVIGGVGGVIIFLPNIMLLFLGIAFFEDTGYLARAAFLVDKLMHKIGLHGRSFIPMLIGFGCSIPGIMATRTLENERDRLTTMLVLPLFSCGARLPIYLMIIPVFFPEHLQATILWLIYLIGILLAIGGAKLLRSTLLKGENAPFVMELPPYRMPTLQSLAMHTWARSWMYLKKAGTVILGFSIAFWFFSSFPKPPVTDSSLTDNVVMEEKLSYSFAGRLGKFIEPVLKPIGFDWKIGTSLIGAFPAKELFVAQMGIIFSLGETEAESKGLRETLKKNYTPLIGFCIMIFCLISMPCIATFAVVRQESRSWKWPLFQIVALTALAYIITLVVYQGGVILGFA